MYNACNWFLIRNTFEEVLGLVSRYSRTLLFYNSVLNRKRIYFFLEHMSITRSTEKMFMLPVSKAKALNIVCWSSMLEIWKNGYAFVFF